MEDVFKKNTFFQQTVRGINWMRDGQYYSTQINQMGYPMVVKMNLATGAQAESYLMGKLWD